MLQVFSHFYYINAFSTFLLFFLTALSIKAIRFAKIGNHNFFCIYPE